MDILVYYKKNKVKEPLEREVFWYDPFWKKMRVFNCSHLTYKWTEEEYIKMKDGSVITVEDGIDRFMEKWAENPDMFENKLLPREYAYKYLKYYGYIKTHSCWVANPVTTYKESSVQDEGSIDSWYEDYLKYSNTSLSLTAKTHEGIMFNINENNKYNFVVDDRDDEYKIKESTRKRGFKQRISEIIRDKNDFIYALDSSGFDYEIKS